MSDHPHIPAHPEHRPYSTHVDKGPHHNDPYTSGQTGHPPDHTQKAATTHSSRAGYTEEDISEEAEVSNILDAFPSALLGFDRSADNSFEQALSTDNSMELDDDTSISLGGEGGAGGTGLLAEGGISRGPSRGHAEDNEQGGNGYGRLGVQGESAEGEAGRDPWTGYPSLRENLYARGLTLYLTPECPASLHSRAATAHLPLASQPHTAQLYIIHLLPEDPDPLGLRDAIANHIVSRGEGMIMDYRWLEQCLDVNLLLSPDSRTAWEEFRLTLE